MRPDDFLQLLRTRPFAPFRIHATDGQTYDVRHPDLTGDGSLITDDDGGITIRIGSDVSGDMTVYVKLIDKMYVAADFRVRRDQRDAFLGVALFLSHGLSSMSRALFTARRVVPSEAQFVSEG